MKCHPSEERDCGRDKLGNSLMGNMCAEDNMCIVNKEEVPTGTVIDAAKAATA